LDFVATKDEAPICRVSGVSDVLHLGGIGGEFHIDCLPKSGLLRVFGRGTDKLIAGAALSSFELFSAK